MSICNKILNKIYNFYKYSIICVYIVANNITLKIDVEYMKFVINASDKIIHKTTISKILKIK